MNALNTNLISQNLPGVLTDSYITVQAAAQASGYNAQYLRRLLRAGKLDGVRIGQVWLIGLASLSERLECCKRTSDRRCGPRIPVAASVSTGVNTPCLQS
jgi:hypothetical protein